MAFLAPVIAAINTTLAAGSIGAFALKLGGSLLLSAASSALMRKPDAAASTIQGRTVSAREAAAARRIIYAFFFVIGLVVPSFFTSAMTILQETVEPERQGRVFGFVGIVISVAMPIGMSVLGPLADVFPVESLLVAAGATQIIAVGLAVMLPAGRKAVKAARASSEANSQTPEAQPAD